jgi:hypothetical protein
MKHDRDPEKTVDQMYLTIELFKCGAQWQGDVFSKKWSEVLYITEQMHDYRIEEVRQMLATYEEGLDYHIEGDLSSNNFAVWIA